MVSLKEILDDGPQARFSLTYKEWMEIAVSDPKGYGLTDSEVEHYKRYLKK